MKPTLKLLTVILIMAFLPLGCGNKPPRQFHEKSGAFSFDPPSGWKTVQIPGLKYRLACGPVENKFTPNINVVDEMFSGSLADYVEANLKNMKQSFVNFNLIHRESLKTNDNEDAILLVTENEQQGKKFRQTFFMIGPKDRKYVVTCTASAETGASFDPLFMESLKTFRLH